MLRGAGEAEEYEDCLVEAEDVFVVEAAGVVGVGALEQHGAVLEAEVEEFGAGGDAGQFFADGR